MTGIANMNITPLAANSAQPEVPLNDAIAKLAGKATMRYAIGIGATNTVTLTQDQQQSASLFTIADNSPGSSAAFNVIFAAFGMGIFVVYNSTGKVATLKINGQPAIAPTLAAGATGIFINDGVNVAKVV